MARAPVVSAAPRIETARLVLRGHRTSDLEARAAMTGDPRVMRFIGGEQGREENVARILRYAGNWALFGRGPFAVEEKAGGRLIGEVGLADFPRGLGEDFDGAPEALWVLAAGAHGKGYATEAMRAAMAWHESAFGPRRMVCIVAPENAESLGVAAKLGFRPFAERAYKERPVLLLERPPGRADQPV